jgi:hypothetical protein
MAEPRQNKSAKQPMIHLKADQNPLSIQKSASHNPSTTDHPKIEENIFFENIEKKILDWFLSVLCIEIIQCFNT